MFWSRKNKITIYEDAGSIKIDVDMIDKDKFCEMISSLLLCELENDIISTILKKYPEVGEKLVVNLLTNIGDEVVVKPLQYEP